MRIGKTRRIVLEPLLGILAAVVVGIALASGDGVGAIGPEETAMVADRVDIRSEYVEKCSNGVVVLFPENNPGLVADCAALLASKDVLLGEDGRGLHWSESRSIREWRAVTVAIIGDGATYRVTGLNFNHHIYGGGILLNGRLPAEIGNLEELRDLTLHGKGVGGSIPSSWGDLRHLETLTLSANKIGASIPASLGKLANVRHISFEENQIEGEIPSSLGALAKLRHLDMANNGLSGSIPRSFGGLEKLEILELQHNNLSGGLPGTLGSLRELRYFLLNNNSISGNIPSTFGGMEDLRRLHLQFNELTGAIPHELGKLERLSDLRLGGNNFSGCIPEALQRILNTYELRVGIGLPFCDDDPTPTPSPTGTPAPTPTSTSTPEPGATAAPNATATPSPTATPAGSGGAPGYGDLLTMIFNINRQLSDIMVRLAAVERRIAYTPTPTATPDPAFQPVATVTPTPEGGAVATAAPSPTMTPSPTATRAPGSVAHCIEAIEESGSFRGEWAADCVTANSPDNQTYYARFYTFRLLAPASVSISLYSADASPYLYLLEGEGTSCDVMQEVGDKNSRSAEISADLLTGRYTIEASTYIRESAGEFQLEFEVSR